MKKVKIRTFSDMGNIKIHNDTMSCFFANGYGDGGNVVTINTQTQMQSGKNQGEFLGHFTVKTKAYLSGYDCDDSREYTFGPGRWFVYLISEGVFAINKCDEDLDS